ncbi:MAG TPA: insulinase family protein [Flavobacteriales bacterium]
MMIQRFLPIALVLVASTTMAQKQYGYSSVPNDPMQTRIYTLDNGLTVYLSRNEDAPRVQTNIAVRAGSKNDPHDATGLAHYLEHMLFKGTSAMATTDWPKESALLLQISNLYEQRRTVVDEAERERLYQRIDSLSGLAAAYAVPNEYDKMISSIGAKGTNAYTWVEQTVYVNDVPTDELEKWMMIESERFGELVLRLFHTELEAVYEEFNMGQDNDHRKAYKAMNEALFQQHEYGTQTTIGTGEHLKNPSMEKIHKYFSTYYVPNNMAVILAGDIDYDRTIAMVDKYFGQRSPQDVPAYTFTPEAPITSPRNVEVMGPMAEWIDLGWRLGGAGTPDELMAELVSGLLSNGQAGLIDLNLLQDQKVLDAGASVTAMKDYSVLELNAEPKEGQSLEQARDLLLAQLQALGEGKFDDWLISAVVNDFRQQRIRYFNDNNGMRASVMTDAFITHRNWKDIVDYYDRMALVTKQQVMDFVKANLTSSNYAAVFKRSGEDKNVYKVSKPKITPVDIKREDRSEWRRNWDAVPSTALSPVFVDYTKAIQRADLKTGIPVAYIPNPTNDLFTLRYIFDMGTNNDRELALAVQYLPYLGTSKLGPVDLKKEFFKLGLSYDVFAGEDRVYVTLSGLEQNLTKGLQLFEALLADAQANEPALQELVSDLGKERQDALKSKNTVLHTAMFNYARYGEHSPFKDRLSVTEMRAVPSKALIDRIHRLNTYQHKVFYYGRKPLKEVVGLLDKEHRVKGLTPYPPARNYPELETTANTVIFVDHDMVQTEMLMVSKAGVFDAARMPYASLFNEYFGSGLSSIVFQEIREAKALAYSAYSGLTTPGRKEQAHYVRAFVGTQADKLNEAATTLLGLMNDMPADEGQFAGAKEAALKVIATDRVTKERIYWSYDSMQRLGLSTDPRRNNYERIPGITLADMKAFFDKEIKGRHYTFLVIGKEGNVDFSALEKLGTVKRMTKAEVFGYDADKP